MTPAQSAAKAKELIQQTIAALGGPAYLKARDTYCDGRLALFGSQGDLNGYEKVFDYVLFPDKERTEYSKKHNIIDVNNGDKGWTLDKGGVEEMPGVRIAQFQDGLKRDASYLFRFRLNEEGLIFRYGGPDIIDLKQVEWAEVLDRDRRTTRIAIEKATHLPLRAVYITRDPETRQRVEETEYFSLYTPINGIQTPQQVSRERNGRKVYQVFWGECQHNTGVAESFFTREALEEQWAKVGKKKKN